MNDPREYGKLSVTDLRAELVIISANLGHLHSELGYLSSEQHRQFLTEYIKSPGGSVSAKNREAEYNSREVTAEVISIRAQINEATTSRDLIVFLLLSNQPTQLSQYPPAVFDSDGLLNVQ